jgi:hypothetical protein
MVKYVKEGFVKCKECKGKKYHKVKFTYKEKNYIYYNKCALCDATGEVDWVKNIQGRIGWYIDNHPAGSLMLISNTIAKNASTIYDGKKYINIHTKRGEALYNELVDKQC